MTTTTHLEMPSPAQLRPKRCNDARFTVRECTIKQRRFNRFLYLTVVEDWQWNDRRGWTDEQWRDYAKADKLRTGGVLEFRAEPRLGLHLHRRPPGRAAQLSGARHDNFQGRNAGVDVTWLIPT